MAAIAPAIATQIRRDREDELIHRGNEYRKAIRKYFRKFGRYPSKIEDLENTNNMRFLRKRYKDPVTGQDFKLIHYGEAHSPSTGLFGQPLQNVTSGSPNPLTGGVNVVPNSPAPNPNPQVPPEVDDLGNPVNPPATGNTGNPPTTTGPNPPTTGGNPNPTTFGGGAIIGVKSSSTKASVKEIKGRGHYNEWEFIYDPQQEVLAGGGTPLPGGMPNVPGLNNNPNQPNPIQNPAPNQMPPQMPQ